MNNNNLEIKNNLYNYVGPANRLKVGLEVTEMIKNHNCNPTRVFHRIAGNNAELMVREIVSTLPLRFKPKKTGQIVKGIREIGRGLEGVVYLGCLDKNCKKSVAIKNGKSKDVQFEFKITKHIHNISPHIVTPYALSKKCSNGKRFYYSEYQSGGSLDKWMADNMNHLKVKQVKTIIFQILYTLYRLHEREPTFRHNDLHLGNVFINDKYTAKGSMRYVANGKQYNVPNVGVSGLVADFGYASSAGFENPMFPNRRLKTSYGIAPGNDPRFDMHFFLNAMYGAVVREPSMIRVKEFIEDVLPSEYLGISSNKLNDFRLIFGVDHSKLPSVASVLGNSFFMTFMDKKTLTPVSPKRKLRMNSIKEETPAVKRYNRNTLMKLAPLTTNHVFKNFGNNITRACLPGMKASEIGQFIATDGTIAAKKELARVFVPGVKVPSKVALCRLLQTFQKGRMLLKRGTLPEKPKAKAKAKTPEKPKAKTPEKPKAKTPEKPKSKAKAKAKTPEKPKVRPPSKLMVIPKGPVATKRPAFALTNRTNRVVLTSNDRRRAKNLAVGISETLVNISNFQKRENEALKLAYIQIKNEKRRIRAAGLDNNTPPKEAPAVVRRQVSPPPQAPPIQASRLIAPQKVAAVRLPGARAAPQPVGQKTGRKAKMLTESPPLKMLPESMYSLNSKDRLKIRAKLCDSYKKEDIANFLKKSGVTVIPSQSKTEMCSALKKKYF